MNEGTRIVRTRRAGRRPEEPYAPTLIRRGTADESIVGEAVGGSVGAVVGILLICGTAFLTWRYVRRKGKKAKGQSAAVTENAADVFVRAPANTLVADEDDAASTSQACSLDDKDWPNATMYSVGMASTPGLRPSEMSVKNNKSPLRLETPLSMRVHEWLQLPRFSPNISLSPGRLFSRSSPNQSAADETLPTEAEEKRIPEPQPPVESVFNPDIDDPSRAVALRYSASQEALAALAESRNSDMPSSTQQLPDVKDKSVPRESFKDPAMKRPATHGHRILPYISSEPPARLSPLPIPGDRNSSSPKHSSPYDDTQLYDTSFPQSASASSGMPSSYDWSSSTPVQNSSGAPELGSFLAYLSDAVEQPSRPQPAVKKAERPVSLSEALATTASRLSPVSPSLHDVGIADYLRRTNLTDMQDAPLPVLQSLGLAPRPPVRYEHSDPFPNEKLKQASQGKDQVRQTPQQAPRETPRPAQISSSANLAPPELDIVFEDGQDSAEEQSIVNTPVMSDIPEETSADLKEAEAESHEDAPATLAAADRRIADLMARLAADRAQRRAKLASSSKDDLRMRAYVDSISRSNSAAQISPEDKPMPAPAAPKTDLLKSSPSTGPYKPAFQGGIPVVAVNAKEGSVGAAPANAESKAILSKSVERPSVLMRVTHESPEKQPVHLASSAENAPSKTPSSPDAFKKVQERIAATRKTLENYRKPGLA